MCVRAVPILPEIQIYLLFYSCKLHLAGHVDPLSDYVLFKHYLLITSSPQISKILNVDILFYMCVRAVPILPEIQIYLLFYSCKLHLAGHVDPLSDYVLFKHYLLITSSPQISKILNVDIIYFIKIKVY